VTQRGGATTPGAGTHRIAVIEIVASLLQMGTPEVGRCRLIVSEPVYKVPMVSALEAII
jgi:hypothetical protein